MHSCEICGRRYLNNLSIHYRLQRNQKTYTCKVCQRDFNNRLLYNKHPQIHTEDKPVSCDTYPWSLKCMSNLMCHDDNYHKGHSTSGIEPTLNSESSIVLGSMSEHGTPLNRDYKQPNPEDYILPTKPAEFENSFPYAKTPKLELILSLASIKHEKASFFPMATTDRKDVLSNNLTLVKTDNLDVNKMPVCTLNMQSNIENKNSSSSMSILQSLLTKPVGDEHKKCLPTLQIKDEFDASTIHSSLLRSRLINQVNTKDSVTPISILESLLTKPVQNDGKKCRAVSPKKIQNEDPFVPTSLLKRLLLASKTEAINEPTPAQNTLDIPQNVENKTISRKLFKVVNVVSLAADLQLSNATTKIKPKFENDILLTAPHSLTKSNSSEDIHTHSLSSSTVNNIELFLPADILKCKNTINFQNAFGERYS